jgi:hypothetical protein
MTQDNKAVKNPEIDRRNGKEVDSDSLFYMVFSKKFAMSVKVAFETSPCTWRPWIPTPHGSTDVIPPECEERPRAGSRVTSVGSDFELPFQFLDDRLFRFSISISSITENLPDAT